MYVSRPVRTIRDDPIAVERNVRETVSAHGGEVCENLEFETLVVEVPHEAVAHLCGLTGLAAIETDDTLSQTLDGAGEDVEYQE